MACPRSTTVIVTYRSRRVIDAALRSQLPACHAGFSRCVVVDNASDDGTAEYIAARYPWVRLVCSGENLGFGRGCNLGVGCADTEYVLFLNPDAEFAFEEHEKLVAFADAHPQATLTAPAIRLGDGRWQDAGGLLSPRRMALDAAGFYHYDSNRRLIAAGGAPFRTDWISGAIFLARRSAFETLGGFTPGYFLYFEETDLCRRAVAAGCEIWTVGTAVGEHRVASIARAEGTPMYSDCIAEHFFRSRFYYLRNHFGLPRAVAAEIFDYGCAVLRAGRQIARGHPLGELAVRLRAPFGSRWNL